MIDKEVMKKVFSPVLQYFEEAEGDYVYKSSHRTILVVVGVLFLILSSVSIFISISVSEVGGLFAILVFLAVGGVCLIVGSLGSDKAVAKLWKSR